MRTLGGIVHPAYPRSTLTDSGQRSHLVGRPPERQGVAGVETTPG
jgi:hypothetical protein